MIFVLKTEIDLNITRLECKAGTKFNNFEQRDDLNITRLECKEAEKSEDVTIDYI